MIRSVAIQVSGKVQDVWYRKYTFDKAYELGLTGTVQNLENGDVLVCTTGTDEQIIAMEKWCWQGSPESDVAQVRLIEVQPASYPDFRIIQ